MGAPRRARFAVDVDEWYERRLYLAGDIALVTEYQSGRWAASSGTAAKVVAA